MALQDGLIEVTMEYISLIAVLLGIAVVTTLGWAPFLLSDRIRRLFSVLPPFESTYPTYIVFSIAAAIPYLTGLMIALATENTGKLLFTVVLIFSFIYVVSIPVIGVLILPRIGVDWDSTGYDISTWVLLFAGACWYTMIFSIPLTIVSIVFSL